MRHEEIFKAYLRKRRNESVSDKTLADDKDQIGRFLFFVGDKELDDKIVCDYQDYIRDYTFLKKGKKCHYSKYSIYQIETKIKKFLRFASPESCESIKPKLPKNRKLPEDMLTEADIEALLNVCQTLRDKALVAFLYESGCRKGELFAIKLQNVVFDNLGAVVTIPTGKTGARRIRVVFAASYLRQYIEAHPNKTSDSPLFCSTLAPYGRLSDSGLRGQLKEIAKRANVKKNVYPHLIRHSRCTQLAKHLTEQQMKVYLGWSPGSSSPQTYVHLAGQDIDPAILKMNGIEVEDTYVSSLRAGRCPRCKEINPEASSYCGKCGMPLRDDSIKQLETEQDTFEAEFGQLIAKYPNILDALAKYKKND